MAWHCEALTATSCDKFMFTFTKFTLFAEKLLSSACPSLFTGSEGDGEMPHLSLSHAPRGEACPVFSGSAIPYLQRKYSRLRKIMICLLSICFAIFLWI